MKVERARTIGTISLSLLIITSTFVIISSAGPAVAEADMVTSTTLSSATSDEVAAASGSNRFVVWSSESHFNKFEIFFRRSTDNGATWKPVVNLSNDTEESRFPQIAASGSSVYVVWQGQTTGRDDILLLRSMDSGATWKAVKNLSNDLVTSELGDIAA